MPTMLKNLLLGAAFALLVVACAHNDPVVENKKPLITRTPVQGGQLPGFVVREASDQHGGSMVPAAISPAPGTNAATATNANEAAPESTPGANAATNAGTNVASVSDGLTVVLGPVNTENLGNAPGATGDAGQSIREVISQRLTATAEMTLFDAPEERYINDSPRPDLARKGIKYVIKGVASHSAGSGAFTVFLRAVDTQSGKVARVASARNQSRDQAAKEAAADILAKITGNE